MPDIESGLVNAFLDALDISPEAYQRKRMREDEDYARVVAGYEQGLTAKEQGLDPKTFEERFGPYRAAQLLGAEKTDAFRQAAQNREMMTRVQQYLTRPQNAGPYSGYEGPSFEGGRAPTEQEYAGRVAQLEQMPGGSELLTRVFGPEPMSAGIQRERLGFEKGPDYDLRKRETAVAEGQLGIAGRTAAVAERNAAVNEAQVAQQRANLVLNKRELRQRSIDNASTVIGSLYPTLNPVQLRKAARFHAGYGTEKSLRDEKLPDGRSLADLPGIVRGARSGQSTTALYNRVNETADWAMKYIKTPANRKDWGNTSIEERNGINNKGITEAALALFDYLVESGRPVNTDQDIMDLMKYLETRISVIDENGAIMTIADLPEAERTAKFEVIGRALRSKLGAAMGGATEPGAGGSIIERHTRPGAANEPPPTGGDWTAGVPIRVGESTQPRPSQVPTPGVTNPSGPGASQRGYIFSPPVVMPRPR